MPPSDAAPYTDIVFDGPPGPVCGRFVEVENEKRESISFGEWVGRDDGYWVLRIPTLAAVRAERDEAQAQNELLGCDKERALHIIQNPDLDDTEAREQAESELNAEYRTGWDAYSVMQTQRDTAHAALAEAVGLLDSCRETLRGARDMLRRSGWKEDANDCELEAGAIDDFLAHHGEQREGG